MFDTIGNELSILSPVVVGAGVIAGSRKLCGFQNAWPSELEEASGFSTKEIQPLLDKLIKSALLSFPNLRRQCEEYLKKSTRDAIVAIESFDDLRRLVDVSFISESLVKQPNTLVKSYSLPCQVFLKKLILNFQANPNGTVSTEATQKTKVLCSKPVAAIQPVISLSNKPHSGNKLPKNKGPKCDQKDFVNFFVKNLKSEPMGMLKSADDYFDRKRRVGSESSDEETQSREHLSGKKTQKANGNSSNLRKRTKGHSDLSELLQDYSKQRNKRENPLVLIEEQILGATKNPKNSNVLRMF